MEPEAEVHADSRERLDSLSRITPHKICTELYGVAARRYVYDTWYTWKWAKWRRFEARDNSSPPSAPRIFFAILRSSKGIQIRRRFRAREKCTELTATKSVATARPSVNENIAAYRSEIEFRTHQHSRTRTFGRKVWAEGQEWRRRHPPRSRKNNMSQAGPVRRRASPFPPYYNGGLPRSWTLLHPGFSRFPEFT